ncbi:hypothetical protein D3H35_17070 [Cohnella faecalis]|uniref:PIN domain-containing protein n=1 Tax=Cohnella faecalis TaxID=2315694 RepID=A0A398CNV7_9BACL|nr:hypothetical protein D3H35_17070 [Cohnella faecalis]
MRCFNVCKGVFILNLVRQAQEEKRRIFFSTITECEVLSGIKHNLALVSRDSDMNFVTNEYGIILLKI